MAEVREERDLVEDVVNRLNKRVGDELMVNVRVKRWEDLPHALEPCRKPQPQECDREGERCCA